MFCGKTREKRFPFMERSVITKQMFGKKCFDWDCDDRKQFGVFIVPG